MTDQARPLPDARSALEDAPCGLLHTDAQGLVFWANRTFCHWVGFDLAQLAGRRRLQDLLTVGGRIFHQTHWAPLLQMQGSISELKLDLVRGDGAVLPVIMNAVLRNHDGQMLQEVSVYIARDRDKYERELLLSRRKLQETLAETQRLRDEAKDRALFAEQMMGIVSHDLRTPMSVIHMSVALLSHTGASTDQQLVLGRITRATERADRMISDLLDFTQARLSRGLSVHPRLLTLGSFIHAVVDELRAAFPNRALRHVHEGGDAQCSADADRLAQLVDNLVRNALAYGDADREITVTSRQDERSFSVAVHNFGKPIPPQQLGTIFLPLTRGSGASANGRSVGLGLYIVSEIARAHEGEVAVRSTEALGTEFTVAIPRRA